MIRAKNTLFGQHPVVHRFLKGAFGSKPLSNRYYDIWETNTGLKGTRVNTSRVIIFSNNTLLRPNISDSYLEKYQDECVCFLVIISAMLTLLGAFRAIT